MASAPTWEYRQEIFQGIELLNDWGAEGWEIAGFFGKDGAFMILKRQRRGRSVVPAADPPATTASASAAGGAPASRSSTSSSSSRSSGGGRSGSSSPGAPKGKFKEMI